MTSLSDDQIIAAAGEPVAYLYVYDNECFMAFDLDKTEIVKTPELYPPLYPADAILSAVKPLRERIAELEAEIEEHVKVREEYFRILTERGDEIGRLQDILGTDVSVIAELRAQLNAALEREKVLRELIAEARTADDTNWCQGGRYITEVLDEALALPHDDTALRQIVEDERERTHGVIAEIIDGCTVSKYATVNECRSARNMAEKIDAAIRARSNVQKEPG